MTPFLAYLVKVIVCSGILYAYYHLALRNNRFHQWNRFYLLAITVLSLAVPLLRIPLSFTGAEAPGIYVYTAQVVTLRDQVFTVAASPGAPQLSLTALLYGLVMALMALRIGWGYFKILQLVRSSHVERVLTYNLVLSKHIAAPFSFFRFIFWNSGMSASTPEGRQMLRHEIVHLRENHSTDKLFMEIVTAVCWINPFFHLIKRELSLVHEFIADKRSVENGDAAAYAQTILHAALQTGPAFHLTNNFSHQPIKRRIFMLTQSRRFRFSYLRRAMIVPVALLIFSSLAFVTEEKMDRLSDNLNITLPQPDARQIIVNPPADTTPLKEPDITRQEIFTVVEQPPAFPGGEKGLNEYLGSNIRYPKAAIEKKIGGTVFVSFIVMDDGRVLFVKTVGAKKGGGLEEEAVRVVKGMPKWKPGKQNGRNVNVQFNLPIHFTLAPPPPPAPAKGAKQPDANGVFTFVEIAPTFKGGDAALNKYLSSNIHYPHEATEKGIRGTIFVSFIVNKSGALSNVRTVGAKKGGGLEEEAVRVVKAMPAWTPGKQDGKPVAVAFNLPIRFVLN
ncbi:MAG: TonB family protein [Chitinophaga sp.]